MFKLIRILHSGVNVPEPCRLPVTAETAYKAGSALKLTSGKADNCGATDAPAYIAAETLAADKKTTVLAYPITGGMLFETAVSAAPTALTIGSKVTLNVSGSAAVGVTATATNGVATIVDLCGAAAAGDKVIVKF